MKKRLLFAVLGLLLLTHCTKPDVASTATGAPDKVIGTGLALSPIELSTCKNIGLAIKCDPKSSLDPCMNETSLRAASLEVQKNKPDVFVLPPVITDCQLSCQNEVCTPLKK